MDAHIAAVKSVSTRVRQFYDTKTAFRVYHGSTNSTRHAGFDSDAIVDVSTLNKIISIDKQARTAIVEPNVPMDRLVHETMKAGLLPPVVMEFPGITVGGGFVGTAGESSSFKHGFFDRTVLSAEVVLANGDIVKASDGSHKELFEGLRGSFGTLGVLTLVELRLIDSKAYVELTYHPTASIDHAIQCLGEEIHQEATDYIDGILFSKTSGVIVTGRLTDLAHTANPIVRHFSRPWDEWFWIHAKSLLSTPSPNPVVELVPVKDYLFRYDRGAFWMGMYAFRHFHVPFLHLLRFLFDYFFHTRIMYHALHASGYTDKYIIQDIAIPSRNAPAFVKWVDQVLGIYPLWLCPLRADGRQSMGHPRDDAVVEAEGYINIGVWGPYPSSQADYVRMNRALEAKTKELGGLKWLYGRVFYTQDEWLDIYDRNKFDGLRKKYYATSLPSIWDKVKDRGSKLDFGTGIRGQLRRIVRGNGLLSGFYGIYKAVLGGDYVLKQKAA